jgi:hypothetical protein
MLPYHTDLEVLAPPTAPRGIPTTQSINIEEFTAGCGGWDVYLGYPSRTVSVGRAINHNHGNFAAFQDMRMQMGH